MDIEKTARFLEPENGNLIVTRTGNQALTHIEQRKGRITGSSLELVNRKTNLIARLALFGYFQVMPVRLSAQGCLVLILSIQ